jgi:hypothetical protein
VKTLRIIAVVGALLLISGEAYRSWGAGRPIAYWMDDVLAGALLIWAASKVGSGTRAAHAFFTGSWGIAAGMLYGSFFGKLYEPARSDPGNFDLGFLTILVGVAFAVAVAGFIASLILAVRADAR